MTGIIVNSRVASSWMTGIPRYLTEILGASGGMEDVAPGRPLHGLAGHAWEQLVLPRRLGGNLLWSPSNTGPLAVARQVVTIHDTVPLDHPEWMSREFSAWYRFLLPRLVRRVRHVIAISAFTKSRLLATTDIDAAKITVIPNGVDARFCPKPPAETAAARAVLRLPPGRYCLTVGSLEPRKNLPRLMAAWAQAQRQLPDDISLVVAGARGKAGVFAQAGLGTMPPRVHLTGHVPDQILPGLYAGATGFACVSAYEGFGLPPLEAMASGIPVLVSNTTAFPEVVGDAGLYTDPFEVAAIAAQLVVLLSTDQTAMAARGLARASGFSWSRTAAATLQLLREQANT